MKPINIILHFNKAVIHKKPTPVQIVDVHYPSRSAAVIKEAYFKQPSTTDYNGVYKGRYIDFEAKETKNKTSFPLQNFHEHQILHMESRVHKQEGITFVLIRFSFQKKFSLLPYEALGFFGIGWQVAEENQSSGRKWKRKDSPFHWDSIQGSII